MKLFGYYRSSTSYRVRIALNLKGQTYETISINLAEGAQTQNTYQAVNPHMTVPTLEADDEFYVQSLAILDWLDKDQTLPSFLPDDATYAQICRELYYAIATEIHAPNNLSVLKYLKKHFNADQSAIEAWYATWIHRTFQPIERRLQTLKWITPNLPFGKPTLFEIVLIPQIYNARRWQTDLTDYHLLQKIDAHCQTLRPFAEAHPDKQPDAPH